VPPGTTVTMQSARPLYPQTLSKVIELCARCVAQRHACKATADEGNCPDDPAFKLLVETAAKEGWRQCYRACKYSVVAWFSRARAANSSYKKLIMMKPIKP